MKTFLPSLILILVAAASCGNPDAAVNDPSADAVQPETTVTFTESQMKNAGITIGKPQEENLGQTITLQGKIDLPPQSHVSLSFPLGGYLRSTAMLPGVHVRKGQVLGVMEDLQYIQLQQDYLTTRSALNLAQTELSRQKELNAGKASSDKILQQAQAEMEKQNILFNALRQKLELIGMSPDAIHADNISRQVAIRSPIDAYVSSVNVNVGKYTAPADVLFELVDPREIHLVLNVFEKDLGQLSVGQHVKTYSNNDPSKKYDAEILLIGKNLDGDRTAEVHCHFERYDPALVPGMFMNGEIAVAGNRGLTIPEGGVVRWQGKYYIFIGKGAGSFEMVEVQTSGGGEGRQTVVADGLSTETSVVTNNAFALLMKIKNAEEGE